MYETIFKNIDDTLRLDAGVDELDVSKFSTIITAKYGTTTDATNALGDLENIKKVFIDFQQYLYEEHAA